MYKLVSSLKEGDCYEYWLRGVPYSARLLDSPLILGESVFIKALVLGGEEVVEMHRNKKVKVVEFDSHMVEGGFAGQPKPATYNGVSID